MDQGHEEVMAANDVWPHTRITVTELESPGKPTFLWFQAENLKEYTQKF